MRLLPVLLLAAASLHGQSFFNYVGQIESRSVLLAWGAVGPGVGNTIGRGSVPLGKATVRIDNRTLPASQNWLVVNGLTPDTSYQYEIDIDGNRRGGGQVRTWPEIATHMCFFVIGDFGNGSDGQSSVARYMAAEMQRKAAGNCPVRFVLTVGDNIYGEGNFGLYTHTGDLDAHWENKFFGPYADVLRQVPFLPSLGNHDGNGNESRGDLFAYLDNFFFPGNIPARWYTFTYAGMAQFFALDSTINTEAGPTAPAYLAGGAQSQWLRQVMTDSKVPWKIPYFHHPIYTAGPRHESSYNDLKHWVDLFQQNGVRVVFTGHEHNFQFSKAEETGGILYLITGAGGELRTGDVRRKMDERHIAGWADYREFLSVEIEGREIRITPLSPEPLKVVDVNKKQITMPIVHTLPAALP